MVYDVRSTRSLFPALHRTESGREVAYLDGPGGTQTPFPVIEAMSSVLDAGVSNLGGGFGASEAADRIMDTGRRTVADLFNCEPNEVSFGQNMTSITFAISRALASSWGSDDAVLLTSLDHDANFTPWARAASDVGANIRVAEFDTATGTLDPATLGDLLDERVRLVAVCLASNSLGSLVDVAAVTEMAHEVGALVYVDAVHAVPHTPIDVRALDCDFLVASAYKFFGPHTGMVFGKYQELDALDFYKVRPAPSNPPGKLETGTQSFESIAGVSAAVDYLAGLSESAGDRRRGLVNAYQIIAEHEKALARHFAERLQAIPRARIHGLPGNDPRRVPTFAISLEGVASQEVATALASQGIYTWAGHYYAVNVMDRLGVLDSGGLLRIGFVHYNSHDEVDRVADALDSF